MDSDNFTKLILGELLEFLKSRSTVVMSKIINVLGNRLVSGDSGSKVSEVKYNSIAVFGNRSNIPVLQFCYELEMALSVQGSVARLSSKIVQKKLGKSCMTGGHDYRINSWLGQQEKMSTNSVLFFVSFYNKHKNCTPCSHLPYFYLRITLLTQLVAVNDQPFDKKCPLCCVSIIKTNHRSRDSMLISVLRKIDTVV